MVITTGSEPKALTGGAKMGKLTTKKRESLPKSDFALPGKGVGPKGAGAGSYPIPDQNHARNALARVAQHGSPEEQAAVRRKVHAKFPGIGEKGSHHNDTGPAHHAGGGAAHRCG